MKTNEAPQSPGSLSEFTARHIDLDKDTVADLYYGSLEDYRNELAAYHGISREDLHAMRFHPGQIATSDLVEIPAQETADSMAS